MPRHKVTFSFVASPGAAGVAGSVVGWSESWYDPQDETTEAATEQAIFLKNQRLFVLSPDWSVSRIRIVQLDAAGNPTRRGRLILLPPQGNAGKYGVPVGGGAGIAGEQPWDAINIAIQTTGGARRAFLMRGIGTGVLSPGGRFLNPAPWGANYAFYIAALIGANPPAPLAPYAVRARSAVAVVLVSNILLAPPANVNLPADATRPLLRVPVMTVQAGNNVSITGVEGLTNINASWRAVQVQLDPTNNQFNYVLLAPRRNVTVSGVYENGGSIRYWNWTFDNITGGTPGNGASRRTGRPTELIRGRRSRRRS